MANPDPEITPEEVAPIRDDVIIATGRSDYPNQVNNVLGFPYIFRGRARRARDHDQHGDEDRGRARPWPTLAREDVPDEVAAAYQGSRPRFGRDYIIPVPFDPRLIHTVPAGGGQGRHGHGRGAPADRRHAGLPGASSRRGATRSPARCNRIFERVRTLPEARGVRGGRGGAGHPRRAVLRQPGPRHRDPGRPRGAHPRDLRPSPASTSRAATASRSHNARLSRRNAVYAQFLYERLQRQGFLFRDCQRLINQDRNHFAASMVALGDADAMVTGVDPQLPRSRSATCCASSTPSPATG